MFNFWSKSSSLSNWCQDISFKVNGQVVNVKSGDVTPDVSLNTFLRTNLNLLGTKFMCLEGGCGVCVVSLRRRHPVTKVIDQFAITSCLYPVLACDGAEIETIEFLNDPTTGPHDLQKRLAHFNGSQCGYCSPAMVMGMYNLQKQRGSNNISMMDVEKSLGGHLCRCTGYRPILDAFKSVANDATPQLKEYYCADIEDIPLCKSTGQPCASQCAPDVVRKCFPEPSSSTVSFPQATTAAEWRKAVTLQDIFNIFAAIGAKKYMLVGGNTAHGVYRRPENILVFIDVNNVAQLKQVAMPGISLEVGGSVTLTDFVSILKDAAVMDPPRFGYLTELMNHVELIASIAVRNIGTIAGNLMIKHQYNEFPSDLFMILETVAAQVVVARGPRSIDVDLFTLEEFLKISMDKRVILRIVLPARDSNSFILKTYKITPRAQNAHAYINAGFLIEYLSNGSCVADKTMVKSARICYGGVNPTFIHATATETTMTGSNLYDNVTIQRAIVSLESEVNPDWKLPDASPGFRKRLAIGLFYKFVLNTAPSNVVVNPRYRSGGQLIERPLSSGIQTFDTVEENYPLTQPVIKLEALMQTTGTAVYQNDVHHRKDDDLWCAFVLATRINYTIARIDATAALAMEGVVAFYSTTDIPGINAFVGPTLTFIEENEELFVADRVKFNGQPVGVLVATSNDLARKAAKMVHIEYGVIASGVKAAVTTLQELLIDEAKKIKQLTLNEADANGIAAVTIIGDTDLQSQYHFMMEPHTTVCEMKEDGMNVFSSTQSIDFVQSSISKLLNLPAHKLSLEVRRLGGGFGAKISRGNQVACACALACYLLKRRVRFVMSIEQMMEVLGMRSPGKNMFQVQVSPEGVILTLRTDIFSDLGCSTNENLTMLIPDGFTSVYDTSNWQPLNITPVVTNTSSNTFIRAPGTLEGIAMIEDIQERIAFELQLDPVQVRLANLNPAMKMPQMMRQFLLDVDYKQRQSEVTDFNRMNRWKKRGLAVVPIKHHILYLGVYASLVSIYHADGTVSVTHGGIEMGQGVNTKVCQVAAHVLGIPLHLVTTKPSREVVSPDTPFTGGSYASEVVCYATLKACQELNRRLQPIRDAAPPNTSWKDLINMAYLATVDLGSRQSWTPGETQEYDVFGVSACEVELDVLTGNTLLRRVDILEDTGESMSPLVDVGQVEGAFVIGLGYWLTEKIVREPTTGQMLTNRTWNYKVPGALDIPVDFRISFLQRSPNSFGVLRSKATGEPATGMACVAMFAIRHAIDAARSDNGLRREWYKIPLPCSPENILLLMGNRNTDFTL